VGGHKYEPFEGICLTDTFQMYEKDDLVDALLVDNSARRKRQKKLDIRVIMGNPPYSVRAEDNAERQQPERKPAWQAISPDDHGDWLRQRDDGFARFIALGDKKSNGLKLFDNFSLGVVTNRDAWAYNASQQSVSQNMARMIGFYNTEVARFDAAHAGLDAKTRAAAVDGFIDADPTRISWTVNLKQELAKSRQFAFEADCLVPSLYRPFTKQWLYFNRRFNERVLQMPRIFPDARANNLAICVAGVGAKFSFCCLIANTLPNLGMVDIGVTQCFPLYLYGSDEDASAAQSTPTQGDLLAASQPAQPTLRRRDAITDTGLAHFAEAYPGEKIGKEDVFYYVYGLLHSPDYRARYADNLAKELPRIPRVKSAADFWAFSKAGRALAELHLNYESVAMYPGAAIETAGRISTRQNGTSVGLKPDLRHLGLADQHFRVEKMKVPKIGKEKDLTRLIYNAHISVSGIPPEAYAYVVNGKPALDWVIERQCVKTDKDSGIVNDANAWAIETMGNPRYPLELFLRVVTVSLETLKIVKSLPALDILAED
jgi:predicted helicase